MMARAVSVSARCPPTERAPRIVTATSDPIAESEIATTVSATSTSIRVNPSVPLRLEHDPFLRNRIMLQIPCIGRIFCVEPLHTSPENALVSGRAEIGDQTRQKLFGRGERERGEEVERVDRCTLDSAVAAAAHAQHRRIAVQL